MSIITIVSSIFLMLALCVPGFVLTKTKMLNEKAIKPLSTMLMYVCLPFMLMKSFFSLRYDPALLSNIFYALFFSVAGTIAVWLVAKALFSKKLFGGQKIYEFSAMFSNCGFFGLPFLATLFPGNEYVILYASIFVVAFHVQSWTLGVFLITSDKKYMSAKKALLNPALLAVLFGLPFFLFHVQMPAIVLDFANFFATMNSPLAMTVLGIRLAEVPLKSLFTDWRAFIASFVRLIAAPVLMWCLLKVFGITDANLFNTMVIAAAMPVAATTVVLAEMYTNDSSIGVRTMLLSTVLCIPTIPIVCMFLLI